MSVRTHRAPALTFGPYQLVERLSGPSITERHRALGRDGAFVVLHVLRPELTRDFAVRALFQVHAERSKSLDHACIAKVVDSGEIDGRLFLAVREVAGQELSLWLSALRDLRERPDTTTVRAIVRDVASALTHAHARGVVHGDVRPGNVIVRPSGGAVLTGFVIARSLRTDTQERIAVAGFAPPYMAPEQANGKGPDERTDLYALGVLTYELLTGRTPYAGEPPLAVLLAHGREPLPLPSRVDPHVGPAVERFLLRALAVDPAARHADVRGFADALDDAFTEDSERAPVAGAPAAEPPATVPRTAWAPPPLYALAISGAVVLLIGIALGVAVGRPSSVATASPAIVASSPVAPLPVAPSPLPTVSPRLSPPTAFSPPQAPLVRKGALLYEAQLAGADELDRVHIISGVAGQSATRAIPGAIELAVGEAGAGIEGFFHAPVRASYTAEFDVSIAEQDAQVVASWALRREGDASYLLRLDARTETVSLVYDDGVRFREVLAPQARVPELRAGRTAKLAVTLDGVLIAVYLDSRQVIEARDARIATTTLPVDVFVGPDGGPGMIRITGARFYALP